MCELSIGYDPVVFVYDENGIRHLREVKLWEISVVTLRFRNDLIQQLCGGFHGRTGILEGLHAGSRNFAPGLYLGNDGLRFRFDAGCRIIRFVVRNDRLFIHCPCDNADFPELDFTKTIAEGIGRVKILSGHNDSLLPIGIPTELREDAKGLFMSAKISDTTLGRDVKTLIHDGVLCELSIGYDPVVFDYDENGIRHLREVKLWEISSSVPTFIDLMAAADFFLFFRRIDFSSCVKK